MTSKTDDLFPLPMTPFEHYMLLDDRKRYPMTFLIQQRFSGVVDRAAFEASLFKVAKQHPLLTALVDRASRIPVWRLAPELSPMLNWANLGEPLKCPSGEQIDLTRELGLRVWVRCGEARSEVTTQFHHSCADGIGAFQFLGDLWAEYGIAVGQDPPPQPREIDAERLRSRDTIKIEPPDDSDYQPPGFWQALVSRIREAFKTMRERPSALEAPASESSTDDFPGISQAIFDTSELRRVAKSKHVALNDILLRDLFLALRDWNGKYRRTGRRSLRITMPTNLRDPDDRNSPTSNRLGYAFITRRESECDDPETLLASIAHDTAAIKRWSLGAFFLDSVAFVRRIPGAMSLFASSRRCFATTVLTNLGDPTRRYAARLPRKEGRIAAGGLVLEQTLGVPPLRPKTRAVFAVFAHRHELTICARCDPTLFGDAASEELLALFTKRLGATAAENS